MPHGPVIDFHDHSWAFFVRALLHGEFVDHVR
ncbi:hypothetical protein [Streptomyces sp. NBC_00038]|nr:hypothetical protein [Streptomyces sp. NBC_00038]MCX5555339.1 hypothetical protein [Streptomyces sp. NBC_00038]